MRSHAWHSRESGFTLVEVLVALLVLSVGLVSVAALFTQGIRLNYHSSARSEATNYVHAKMEELKALAFADGGLAVGGALPPAAAVVSYNDSIQKDGVVVASGGMYVRQWKVELEGGNPNLKRITVAVRLNAGQPQYDVTIVATTLRAKG